MRGPWSLRLSQLRAGSSISDCPPAVHPLSPRPTPTSAFRAVVPVQLGPGPSANWAKGLSHLLRPVNPLPSARLWTLAHPDPIRRALGLRDAPGHQPPAWHSRVRAASAPSRGRGPQIRAPVSAHCRPRLPYSGSGGGASETYQWGEAVWGRAPGLPHKVLGLPKRSVVAIATERTPATQRSSYFCWPGLAICHPSCSCCGDSGWRSQPPPLRRMTLGKSSRSFYFFLKLWLN